MGSVIGLDSIRFVGRLRSGIDWLKREYTLLLALLEVLFNELDMDEIDTLFL